MDAIQALVSFAQGIFSGTLDLVWVLGSLLAITGAVSFLAKEVRLARLPQGGSGSGRIVAYLLFCAGLVGLQQIIGVGASQFGWNAVTFDAVSYVSTTTFGVAADAANAILTLVRALGVVFCLNGVLLFRRSLKDGHTGLSAGQDVSSGGVRFITGVLCICNPYLLDALQSSLGMTW